MRIRITLIIAAISLILFAFSSQQITPDLILSSSKGKAGVKISEKHTNDKIQAVLGKAISMDKQVQENGEDPIFVIVYDGLTIETQSGFIKFISISSSKWKLNNYTIGSPIETIESKFEKSTKMYLSDLKFKLKDGNGILFVDSDTNKKVKKIGVFY